MGVVSPTTQFTCPIGLLWNCMSWIKFCCTGSIKRDRSSSFSSVCLQQFFFLSLTLPPSPFFVSPQKWGFSLGFELGASRTTMHCPPMACHSGVAAWAVILFPYETCFYDVIGLSTFSSLAPCWVLLDGGRFGFKFTNFLTKQKDFEPFQCQRISFLTILGIPISN